MFIAILLANTKFSKSSLSFLMKNPNRFCDIAFENLHFEFLALLGLILNEYFFSYNYLFMIRPRQAKNSNIDFQKQYHKNDSDSLSK